MKKLLIALALPLWAATAQAQTYTTYGTTYPMSTDAGYVGDYATGGTVVQAGGSVTLANGTTYEHGNLSFQNDGSWESQTGSLDLFSLTGAVTISGTVAPDFYNLQFQNAGTVAISNTDGANVANSLLFGNSGVVSTVRNISSNGAISFAGTATYTGGTTDAQHVNGYVTKTGNNAFTFPIGDATDIRTLSISVPAVTTTISAAWFTGSPATTTDPSDGTTHSITSLDTGLMSISTAGFWDYVLIAGNDVGMTLTVSIPDMSAFSPAADMRLAGWNGTKWLNLSGSTGASGVAENSTLSGVAPAGQTITALAIATIAGTPLPVKYVYFNATANGCVANLEWKAITDAGFGYFSVESSVDGNTFTTVSTVQAVAAPSTGGDVYSFADKNPPEGISYYRIKYVETDGSYTYTQTKPVTIRCTESGPVRVYPTVTNGLVHVDLPAGYEQATIMLTGINGQQIQAATIGSGLVRTIQFNAIAAGAYLVTVKNNDVIETFKILYQP